MSTTTFANKFEGLAEGAINNKSSSIINAINGNQLLFTGDVVKNLPIGPGNFIATITVGDTPVGVAVNESTNTLYVTIMSGGGLLKVIDITDNTILKTITIGDAPDGVAVNETTNTIYVANGFDSALVSVIVGATNTLTAPANVGSDPSSIAVNETTNRIYVTNVGSDSVSVIDGTDTSMVTTINLGGSSPMGVAVNETTNTIYVSNSTDSTLLVIDGDTQTVTNTIPTEGAGDLIGVAVNETTNRIYVTNSNSIESTVTVIDGATNTVIAPINVEKNCNEIAVNEITNTIYAANSGSDNVSVINGATNLVTDTITVGDGPLGIAVNETTNLIYVANSNTDTVSVFTGVSPPELILSRVGVVSFTGESGYGVVVGGNQKGVYGDGEEPSTTFEAIEQGILAGIENDSVRVCTQGICLARVINETGTPLQVGTSLTPDRSGTASIDTLGAFKAASINGETILARLLQTVPSGTPADTNLRVVAVDVQREGPASGFPPLNWFDTTFKRRVPITINSGQVPSEQTDFPFLFNSVLADLSNAQSLGQDIRFANFDGDVEFKVEVEDIDTGAGTLQAWTKVPSIENELKFFMYYGNPTVAAPLPAVTQAVWSDYSAVYHLNQATGATVKDSTVNANDGTPVPSGGGSGTNPVQQLGKINGNLLFNDNPPQRVEITDSDTLDPLSGAFSFSFWMKSTQGNARQYLVAKQNRIANFRGWLARLESNNKLQVQFRSTTGTMSIDTNDAFANTGVYQYVVVNYNGNGEPADVIIYVDSVVVDVARTGGTVGSINTPDLASIGADNLGGNGFKADIDEVRISQNEKSADFIIAEFNNQNAPDTFYTVGAVQTIP